MTQEQQKDGPYTTGDMVADQYKILRVLGRGGMGVVYKAWDEKLERNVAIKVLHKRLVDAERNEALLKRFQREAIVMASLQNPNIVTVYYSGKTEQGPFIVMEFIDGKNLSHVVWENGPLSPKQAIPIFIELCKGLEYAHDRQILHRDIKPGNIMISPNSGVKIMDFGLAKILDDGDTPITQAGQILGTTHYMAPELVRYTKMDTRGDIFSLGAVLYEVLTGQQAFPGNNTTDVLVGVLKKDPEPPSMLASSLSPKVDQVVLKALAKDPDQRYQSARDFESALKTLRMDLGYSNPKIGLSPEAGGEVRAPSAARSVLNELRQPSGGVPAKPTPKVRSQQVAQAAAAAPAEEEPKTNADLEAARKAWRIERTVYQAVIVVLVVVAFLAFFLR